VPASYGSPDYVTLSAMITPALFMTANGSLIISTSNRMSRIVDRIRQLNDATDRMWRGEAKLDFLPERQAHIEDQLRHLIDRMNWIRVAMVLLYVAFACFVGTSFTLAVDQLFGHWIIALPTGLAVVGVSLMFVASINLIREALAALYSNRLEIRFYQDLVSRRRAEAAALPAIVAAPSEPLPSS
jgi:ABC-type multidrug transport system fused ATPase/permease subunit